MHRTMPQNQRGVALFIALIALVVLMISAIALTRSTDTAQLIAGNLAIKRDMTHESELAIQAAIGAFAAGALNLEKDRWNSIPGANYSASALPSNNNGIPVALITAPTSSGESAPTANGITYRYLIDRMCPTSGNPTLPASYCMTGLSKADVAVDAFNVLANGGAGQPRKNSGVVYRISVRVTDARRNQSFFQTTLTSIGS